MINRPFIMAFLTAISLSSTAFAAPILFSVGGSNAASIQGTVDGFRSALGDPNNGNAPGPLPSGRREINWDGGGVTTNAPGATPFDVFLNTRGGRFVTPAPGTGFVQAPPSGGVDGGLAAFFNNATYGVTFANTFSPSRLFTPVGSNITDALFFVPGTNGGVQATVAGFGAVFSDVDLDGTTLQFFDLNNDLLNAFPVPVATVSSGGLSFVGVVYDAGERVARVRITTGNSALGPNDGGASMSSGWTIFCTANPRPSPNPPPSCFSARRAH